MIFMADCDCGCRFVVITLMTPANDIFYLCPRCGAYFDADPAAESRAEAKEAEHDSGD
jgi:hypothetical protein